MTPLEKYLAKIDEKNAEKYWRRGFNRGTTPGLLGGSYRSVANRGNLSFFCALTRDQWDRAQQCAIDRHDRKSVSEE